MDTFAPASPTRFMRRSIFSVLLLLGTFVCSVAHADPVTAATAIRKTGYITVADGTRLKWTALLPEESGKFPVLMQYEGYLAGSFPHRVNGPFADEMLQAGYAILGVSLRGTACSGGAWDPFLPVYGEDGAEAVEWAAAQPWSSGKVGMFSFSFAGIMQLFTAIHRPAGLKAIAPGMAISDTYRDIGFPGGILNNGFPPLWDVALHQSWASAAGQAQQEGDVECLSNIAIHQAENEPYSLLVQGPQHLFLDSWHQERSSVADLPKINVPILGMTVDQDEQVGPRGGLSFERTDPALTWTITSNGYHGLYQDSRQFHGQLHIFFDRYLRGIDNGWERTPHVQLWHETLDATKSPTWVTGSDTRPIPVTTRSFALGADGLLARGAGMAGSKDYLFPTASPTYASERIVTGSDSGAGWASSSVVPGGYAAYTTAVLKQDLLLTGTASLDLWISTLTTDADVQATITEVRPDGQELYVQRGWLRLSHRTLDEVASTPLNPVHAHTEAAQVDMPVATPQRVRLGIQPFTHVFRAGSRMRLWLDTPSVTGLWNFLLSPTPTTVTVLNDASHPSKLTVGMIKGATAQGHPLPACGALALMLCRADPLPASNIVDPDDSPDTSGGGGSGGGGTIGASPDSPPQNGVGVAASGAGRFGGGLSWLTLILLGIGGMVRARSIRCDK